MTFVEYCQKTGIELIRQLQPHIRTLTDYKSSVWLIRDRDRMFKVAKELVFYLDSPNEKDIFEHLPKLTFIPRFYGLFSEGLFDHENTRDVSHWYKRSFIRGHPLSFNGLSKEAVLYIMHDLVAKLKVLLDNGVIFVDLRPDNILLSSSGVALPDLGLSRILGDKKEVPITVPDCFAAPEQVLTSTTSEKSLVYQIGMLSRHLTQETIPFTEMIDPDREKRPTLDDCLKIFECPKVHIQRKIPGANIGTILFPARMGIPHKGHISFISALLDMGYKVLISLQRSYTITDRDPLPKWLVMKMVAKSLIREGYNPDCFGFYLTPFYKTDKELKMHFNFLPESGTVAVASSNPKIPELFPTYDFITQKDVLGFEDEPYEDQSWGEILRTAVKENDYETFTKYAASGVEEILTFKEIQEMYGKPEIEFVPGKVYVRLLWIERDMPICYQRVSKYTTPEGALMMTLGAMLLDKYDREPKITLQGANYGLQYIKTEFTEGDVWITYKLNQNPK